MITKKQLEKMLRRLNKQWNFNYKNQVVVSSELARAGSVAGQIGLLKKLIRSYSK